MSAKVTWAGKDHRPTWDYSGERGKWRSYEQASLQMLESCRNVMEDVVAELKSLNALLHCHNFTRIPATLDKVVTNTTRKPRAKTATVVKGV